MLRPPPISTLFPYTTLFRSVLVRTVSEPFPKTLQVPASQPDSFRSAGTVFRGCSARAYWLQGTPLESADKRSEEHTSELQSRLHLVCRLLLEKKKLIATINT